LEGFIEETGFSEGIEKRDYWGGESGWERECFVLDGEVGAWETEEEIWNVAQQIAF
jgi:hypothetical protein